MTCHLSNGRKEPTHIPCILRPSQPLPSHRQQWLYEVLTHCQTPQPYTLPLPQLPRAGMPGPVATQVKQ